MKRRHFWQIWEKRPFLCLDAGVTRNWCSILWLYTIGISQRKKQPDKNNTKKTARRWKQSPNLKSMPEVDTPLNSSAREPEMRYYSLYSYSDLELDFLFFATQSIQQNTMWEAQKQHQEVRISGKWMCSWWLEEDTGGIWKSSGKSRILTLGCSMLVPLQGRPWKQDGGRVVWGDQHWFHTRWFLVSQLHTVFSLLLQASCFFLPADPPELQTPTACSDVYFQPALLCHCLHFYQGGLFLDLSLDW